jgi:stage III sporulation protein SpoIIIAA
LLLESPQIIGSAHGEGLRDLLKNQKLNGLLGGTEQVILGDAAARDNDKRKMKVGCTWLQLGPALV